MSPVAPVSYDDLAYETLTQPRLCPENFALMARLFGVEAPPAASCSVLELGCGSGQNLMSIAYTSPGVTCVGFDNAERAIEKGKRRADEIVLPNLRLDVRDILDVDEAAGRFDYIICHGVFSWVPREVQDKILEIAAVNLADNGVAYLSFNSYPGWRLRGMVREMMLHHIRPFTEPSRRAEQSRAIIDLLARFSTSRSAAYRGVLREEADYIQQTEDWYLLHDNVGAINAPFYFHEFAERAQAAGLQYLGPAQFVPWETRLPEEASRILDRLSSRIEREQYLDFLAGRMFRRSLFCHTGLAVQSRPSADALPSLFVSADSRPVSPHPDTASSAVETFETHDRGELSTGRPLLKTALTHLAEIWPRAESFSDLWTAVSRRLPPDQAARESVEELAGAMLLSFQTGFVNLHLAPPTFASRAGERPVASALARLEARDGSRVTNLRHQSIEVDALLRLLIEHCDGSRDRAQLLDLIVDETEKGDLDLYDAAGELARDRSAIREAAQASLEECLLKLANNALLTA